MRALRVEANPVRARRLLAGYLDRHPGGSLAEEALAMSIEAAVAHGDDDAPALARKYVRRYPAGHFSGLARRTLAGAAGTAIKKTIRALPNLRQFLEKEGGLVRWHADFEK